VHAGRGGLYYRACLGGAHESPISQQTYPSHRRPIIYAEQGRMTMVEVKSDDVAAMRDAKVADLVDDLNKKQAQISYAVIALVFSVIVGVIFFALFDSESSPASVAIKAIALVAALPAWAIGDWFDSYKRTSVLFYNLEGAAEAAYRQFTESFDSLAACHGKWHVPSGAAVRDLVTWKRNAGASHLINRKTASLAYQLPKVLRSNITPPAIALGSRTFYFLPELMLVKHEGRFGAVGYDDLQIRSQTSRFIENGAPPADAAVVDHTWKHPNKNGGPDRRFRGNRQLPVCLYEVMHLSSESGVNEMMEFSRIGVVQPFSTALHELPRRQAKEIVDDLIPFCIAAVPERAQTIVPISSANWSPGWRFLSCAAALTAVATFVTAYTLIGWSRNLTNERGSFADFPPSPTTTSASSQSRTPPAEVVTRDSSNISVETNPPSLPTVTVKTPANIRSEPDVVATVIRVARVGEKFSVFGRAKGWVQVGTARPQGWIAGSLLIE